MIIRAVFAAFAALLFVTSSAHAQADHLQCFKIKDSVVKKTYQADLTPSDNSFAVAAGCVVKVPAKLLCIDVQKSNVTPAPPGSPAGVPAQKYLCYKVSCPKPQLTTAMQDQFGSHTVILKSTSMLCAPEPVPTPPCVDADADGYFAPACGSDCDDNNLAVNPGALEVCGNVIDDDCDGTTDEAGCTCTTSGQCPAVANGSGLCQAGSCTFSCNSGYFNCNGNNIDGCEINVTTDPANCSGCGMVCPPAFPNCVASVCQ